LCTDSLNEVVADLAKKERCHFVDFLTNERHPPPIHAMVSFPRHAQKAGKFWGFLWSFMRVPSGLLVRALFEIHILPQTIHLELVFFQPRAARAIFLSPQNSKPIVGAHCFLIFACDIFEFIQILVAAQNSMIGKCLMDVFVK